MAAAEVPGDRVMAAVLPERPEGGAQAGCIVVPAASAVKIPAGLDMNEAATLPMNGLTALYALEIAGLEPGGTLAVSGGAGYLASLAVPLAHQRGLRVIADARADEAETVRVVDHGQARHLAGRYLDLFQRSAERVAVIRVAGEAARAPATKPSSMVVARLTLQPNSCRAWILPRPFGFRCNSLSTSAIFAAHRPRRPPPGMAPGWRCRSRTGQGAPRPSSAGRLRDRKALPEVPGGGGEAEFAACAVRSAQPRRLRPGMRVRCAKGISAFFRSLQEIAPPAVPAVARSRDGPQIDRASLRESAPGQPRACGSQAPQSALPARTASSTIALPIPPAAAIAQSARPLRPCISWKTRQTSTVPDAPIGWPRASAPPETFVRSGARPAPSAQAIACAAKASISSMISRSPARARAV